MDWSMKPRSKHRKITKSKKKLDERNELVLAYREYVEHVAGHLVQSLGLPREHFDEFVSAGYIGLVEAAGRWEPGEGRDFKTWAYLRIRGSIIDSIRSCSDLKGNAYRYAKALQAAHELREDISAAWIDSSADRSKKNSAEEMARLMDYAASGAMSIRLSFCDAEEELAELAANRGTPEEILGDKEVGRVLRKMVAKLPEKERIIVEEFYLKDRSFGEILKQHRELSKSWLSRLHSRALEMLRNEYLEQHQAS